MQFSLSRVDRHLDCFHFEAIANTMAVEIPVQVFWCTNMYVFLLDVCPGMKLLVHRTCYIHLASIIIAQQFSKIFKSIFVPTSSSCSTSLLNTWYYRSFRFKHSDGSVVISPFGFQFHFFDDEVEHHFKYLLTI